MTERRTSAGSPPAVGVVGVGWVGLVTAACFASQGHEVWAMDVDAEKIDRLSRGELSIHEPGLPELVAEHAGRLHFTTSMDELLGNARLLFCCVDTPPTYSGDADLSRVRAVVAQLSGDSEHALVMKSTVPSGTGESIRRDLPSLAYVSCPEFLQEGTAVRNFLEPDRVVIGADPGDEWAADAVAALYEPLGGDLVRTDVASAEMIKLASNAFLATKISFINEIANVCEEVGADVTEVARGMGLDERIGDRFLQAGIGYGGSCLVGSETVVVRHEAEVGPRRLDQLFAAIAVAEGAAPNAAILEPDRLEALALGDDRHARFQRVTALTARPYDGELITVRTDAGQQVRCTADHPFVVVDPASCEATATKLASQLRCDDWLPSAAAGSAAELWAAGACAPAGVACSEARYTGPDDLDGGGGAQTLVRGDLDRGGGAQTLVRGDLDRGGGGQTLVRERGVEVAAVRVAGIERSRFSGRVYSLEVPESHTFVTSGGLITHNCFPKDVSALKQLAGNSGYHFQLLNSVIEVNELQKRRVIGKLTKHLGSLAGLRVALLGLAFKPNTDDMREASSLVLSARLQGEGAHVVAFDPVAHAGAEGILPTVELADSAAAALDGADAAILVTEWPEFAELDWAAVAAAMKTPLLVDGRNFLDPEALGAAGFIYEGIGRGSSAG